MGSNQDGMRDGADQIRRALMARQSCDDQEVLCPGPSPYERKPEIPEVVVPDSKARKEPAAMICVLARECGMLTAFDLNTRLSFLAFLTQSAPWITDASVGR